MSVQDEVRQYLSTQALPEFVAHINVIKPAADANTEAGTIIALIQTCVGAGLITNGHEVIAVVNVLLTLDQVNFDIAIDAMSQAARVPIIVGASPTAVRIAWWRNVITALFAGGLTIAAINAIVPIPFAFIATTIFAGGKAAATAVVGLLSPVDIGNAVAQAAAQAAQAVPGTANMVAGPSMDALKSLGGYFYFAAATVLGTLAAAAVNACRAVAGAAIENCTMVNSEKVADAAFLTLITKGMRSGGDKLLDFLTIFYSGGYDEYFANIIDNGGLLDLPINDLINTVLASAEDVNNAKIKVKWFAEGKALYDKDLDVTIEDMIEEYYNAVFESLNAPEKRKTLERLSILLEEPPNANAIDRLISVREDRMLAVLFTLQYIKRPKLRPGFGLNTKSVSMPLNTIPTTELRRLKSADARFSNVEDTTRLHPTTRLQPTTGPEFSEKFSRNAPKFIPELLNLYTGDVDFQTIIKDNRNLKIAIMKSKDQYNIYNAIINAPTRMGQNHPINQYNYIEAIMEVLPEEEKTLELKTEVDERLKTILNDMDVETRDKFDRDRDRERDSDRRGGGRRKSRRYKKRRSTLKRRRMKRRRTRKGKKRRHTRRR